MKLLPGQIIANGASSLIFGTNTTNYDTSLWTNTNIQQQLKAAGITVIRTPLDTSSGTPYSDAQLDQLATAIANTGAVMLAILPHAQDTFNQHAVKYLGSRCNLYEYYNEPDINNLSWQNYLGQWNTIIPLLRAINPNAAFIGPTLGVFSNVDGYLIPWLQGCKASGVLPDAVSYHVYPCTGGSIPQATCSTRAINIGNAGAQLRTKIHATLGYDLPVACTEWNADAFYNNAVGTGSNAGQGYNSNASSNNNFNHQFAIDAIEGMITNSVVVGCQFEIGYFLANKNGATSSAPQYTAIQAESKKYLSGTTVPTPVPAPTPAPTPIPTPTPVPVPTPTPATTGTPTTFYLAAAVSATKPTASQLYSVANAGQPSNTWTYTRVGTGSGYGEITSQGSTSPWAGLSSIGAPTGKGWFYELSSLAGQQVVAGLWKGNIRLNCAQNGDTHPEAGNFVADVIKRAFKYVVATDTYIPIASLSLIGQNLGPAYTTYALPANSGVEMDFEPGTLLYVDEWGNITQNTNNNPLQDIRSNRHSTDITGKTGDVNTAIVSPGFVPTPANSSTPPTITVQATLTNAGIDLLRDGMVDRTIPLLAYVAIGSNDTAASSSDTQLHTEVSRAVALAPIKGTKHGELLVSMPVDATTTDIQEIGLFGGISASATANSGVLLARGVCDRAIAGPATLQLDLFI